MLISSLSHQQCIKREKEVRTCQETNPPTQSDCVSAEKAHTDVSVKKSHAKVSTEKNHTDVSTDKAHTDVSTEKTHTDVCAEKAHTKVSTLNSAVF